MWSDYILSEHYIVPVLTSGINSIAHYSLSVLLYHSYCKTCWIFRSTQVPPCLIVSLLRIQQCQRMIRFKLIARKSPPLFVRRTTVVITDWTDSCRKYSKKARNEKRFQSLWVIRTTMTHEELFWETASNIFFLRRNNVGKNLFFPIFS